MPPKKYFKKKATQAKKFVKKRYTTRTGQPRVNALARDVMAIKRSLNVEHKHIDWQMGTQGNIALQKPTKDNPVVVALNTPVRGTSYNNRVGNQIKLTHLTAKYQFTFHNNTDLIQRQNVRARIIFARSADSLPQITSLLEPDANGHYTDQSFINGQEYKKFLWMKSLDTRCGYTQPTNRYPEAASGGNHLKPYIGTPATESSVSPAIQALNIANFFKRAETKASIRMMFKNDSDDVEQMKPYLLLTSDIIDAGPPEPLDYVTVSADIRMTYVDN